MPGRNILTTLARLCGAASAAAIALGGGYAMAQAVTVEELTVEARPTHGPPATPKGPTGDASAGGRWNRRHAGGARGMFGALIVGLVVEQLITE